MTVRRRLGGFLLAICDHHHQDVSMFGQGTAIALHLVNDAMQVGLMYLGAGALLWLVIAVIALWIR
jgi:hypothetical protein